MKSLKFKVGLLDCSSYEKSPLGDRCTVVSWNFCKLT